MSTEPADWLGPAGLLVLACTGALASVALLRRPCRRLFGAENAFLLWGLPPLAMLASQLPHPAAAGPGVLSGAAWVVISLIGIGPTAAQYTPAGLSEPASALALGATPDHLALSVVANIVLCALLMAFAWLAFRRQELASATT